MKRKVTCFTSMALAVLMAVSPVVGSSVSVFAAEPSDDTAAIQVTPSKEDVSDEIVVETDSDAIEIKKEMQASAKVGDTGESDIVVETEYQAGDSIPVHVTAENPADKAADFRLYFWDYGESLPEDKGEWSEVLTDACEDIKIAELQDTDEYIVDLKQGEDTVQGKVSFISDKDDNDQMANAYLSIELPAGAAMDTVFHISSDVAETVTVIPVFGAESENAFYGDAAVAQWKENPIVVEADQSEDTAETEPETEDADAIVVETEEPADSFLSIYVGDSSAETETEEPVVEAEAETDANAETEAKTETDTESEVSVEAETEEDDAVTVTPDTADLNASDFASMRLVVLADDASVITNDSDVIGQYGYVYLLQFTSIQQAMNAYTYYKDKVTAVEPDATVETAAETESVRTADIAMTEDENPVAMLNEVEASEEVQDAHGVIALIDTGVSESENVIDRVSVIDDVLEGNGHGDEMVKAIVSQDAEAEILSIRAMDDNGFGTVSSLVAAMEYAIEQKVDIINLSLYAKSTLMTSVLKEEILRATDTGILVVGSAGNDGQDAAGYMPGAVEEAYIIGAAKEDGSRLEISNFGETVDYNVVAGSTSEAAALFTGYVSANGLDAVGGVLNQGLIYATDYVTEEIPDDTDNDVVYSDDVDKILFSEPDSLFKVAGNTHDASMQDDYSNTDKEVFNSEYDVIMDAVNEAYVRNHLNPDYATIDKFELSNMLRVKQTLMDGSKVEDTDTIDSIMKEENAGEKYITMLDSVVALYDVSDDSEYLVGFANTLMNERQFRVQDSMFAITNNDGEVISDAFYDTETGLAYVPKKYFENAEGGNVLYTVQIQLMQVTDSSSVTDVKSAYAVLSESEEETFQNSSVGDTIFRLATDIEVPDGVDGSDTTVVVNGLPVGENICSYNEKSNSFELAIPSGAISSVSLVPKASTANSMISTLAAGSSTVMTAFPGVEVELSPNVVEGYFAGSCNIEYAYGNGSGYLYSYGWTDMQAIANIVHGGGNLDFGSLQAQTSQMNIELHLGYGYTGTDIPGIKFSATDVNNKDVRLRLQCGHISNPLGSASGGIGGAAIIIKADVRCLWRGVESDGTEYVVLGFLTQTTHRQAGAGLIKFKVKPGNGALKIEKSSGNTAITNGNGSYTLAGAVYGVYKDANCSTLYKTMTTGNDGTSLLKDVPLGNYWIKEITPPNGYQLDPSVHAVTITANNTAQSPCLCQVRDTPYTGSITVRKTSSEPEISNNNSNYSFAGAEFTIYTNSACTQVFDKITTDSNGVATRTDVPLGSYWVKETKSPKGFILNTSWVGSGTLSATSSSQNLSFDVTCSDAPETGNLRVYKKSALPNISENNACYSFENAEFTIYKDVNCTQVYKTITTDKKGVANCTHMPLGDYWVKETKAPKGFLLNTEWKQKVTITANHTTEKPLEIECKDVPGNDPTGIEIDKIYNGPDTDTVKKMPLTGTQFTIKYYDGYYNTENELKGKTPLRTWVLEVKEINGRYMAMLTDSYLVSGELYRDGAGQPCLPLGTITIQETKAAPGYTLDGYLKDKNGNVIATDSELYVAKITEDSGAVALQGGNEFKGENTPTPNIIKLKKFDSDGKTPLAGVTFEIRNSDGDLVEETKTNSKGEIVFDDLYPDVYTIKETATVDGHTLLKDPIVIEVPMMLTDKEVKDYGIDTKDESVVYNEANKTWYIHEFTFEVTNNVTFKMPMSGGFTTPMTFVPLIAGMGIMGVLGVVGFRRKRKK